MDAQTRSDLEPEQQSTYSLTLGPVLPDENDDGFPTDLSAVTETRLMQLCDLLFVELDSKMPDLRALERYQAACDELTLRQISSGVA